jgi:hypothetical protein
VWRHVGVSIFCVMYLVFLSYLNHGFVSSFSEQTVGYQFVNNRRRWTVQQESELKAFLESDANVDQIAAKLQKKPRIVIGTLALASFAGTRKICFQL